MREYTKKERIKAHLVALSVSFTLACLIIWAILFGRSLVISLATIGGN